MPYLIVEKLVQFVIYARVNVPKLLSDCGKIWQDRKIGVSCEHKRNKTHKKPAHTSIILDCMKNYPQPSQTARPKCKIILLFFAMNVCILHWLKYRVLHWVMALYRPLKTQNTSYIWIILPIYCKVSSNIHVTKIVITDEVLTCL